MSVNSAAIYASDRRLWTGMVCYIHTHVKNDPFAQTYMRIIHCNLDIPSIQSTRNSYAVELKQHKYILFV